MELSIKPLRSCWLLVLLAAVGCSSDPAKPSDADRRGGANANTGSGVPGLVTPTTGPGVSTSTAGSGSTLIKPPANGAGPEELCASAVVQTNKTMPTIVFVVDGSGSMCAPFGMVTRWQALRSALLDPTMGLIYRLQKSVSFGATLYDGTVNADLSADPFSLVSQPACAVVTGALGGLLTPTDPNVPSCPRLLEAMPAKLDNAPAIDMVFPMTELGGSTPTDKAISHVMDALIASRQQQTPDQMAQGETYVILATDGAPNDICLDTGLGGDGSVQRQGVVAAVDRGAAAGITTWVISLADGDPNLQAHLDEVAKHGDIKNPNARTFSPTNPEELIMTLAVLLGGAVGCHVALNGTVVVGQECLGTVEQNGVALPCCEQPMPGAFSCAGMPTATPNGWYLSDPHSVELVGDACAQFLLGSGASFLSARFPCKVFQPD